MKMNEIKNGNITPAMRLVQFTQANETESIILQANFGKSVRFYVWAESEKDGLDDLYTASTNLNEPFTHKMCDEWIFAANQAIEQHLANMEMALRQAA